MWNQPWLLIHQRFSTACVERFTGKSWLDTKGKSKSCQRDIFKLGIAIKDNVIFKLGIAMNKPKMNPAYVKFSPSDWRDEVEFRVTFIYQRPILVHLTSRKASLLY
jgi:hypothetical protein